MPLLPRWYSDDGTLIARNTVSSAAAEGNQPGKPKVDKHGPDPEGSSWENRPKREAAQKMREAPEGQEEGPDPRDGNQVYKLEGEAAPKATEALRKGADAARGRGRRKRPKEGPIVPENRCKKLVSKQREEHGTARLLLQCSGGVCREGFLFLPCNN